MNVPSRAEDLFAEFVSDGEEAINRFISEQRSEELFLDYKKSADDGNGTKLHHTDRGNLAKAISGFGNSEGGIIVWGVTCQRVPNLGDVPTGKVPISNPKRFVSWLEGAGSGCTLPPHTGVRNHAIENGATTTGYAVTHIPKGMLSPYQCIVEPYRFRYYLRAGSNFEQVPHGLLAGMFGRTPAPSVYPMWGVGGGVTPGDDGPLMRISTRPKSTPYAWLEVMLVNDSAVMARDLYVNFRMTGPGEHCEWELRQPHAGWQVTESIGGWHAVAEDNYKLAPSACIPAIRLNLYLVPPFADLWYEITLGCTGAPVQLFERKISHTEIAKAHLTFLGSDRKKRAGFELAKKVFALADESNVEASQD